MFLLFFKRAFPAARWLVRTLFGLVKFMIKGWGVFIIREKPYLSIYVYKNDGEPTKILVLVVEGMNFREPLSTCRQNCAACLAFVD